MSTSNPLYGTIPVPKHKRNNFSLSHRNYVTMNQHKLTPTLIKEIIPGDIFSANLETFARVQPMIAPPLSSISISHHVFYVPLRTLSDVWEDFITGGREGTNEKVLPYTTLSTLYYLVVDLFNDSTPQIEEAFNVIHLLDYMGLPFNSSLDEFTIESYVSDWISRNIEFENSDIEVNLLPFVAYQKIYDEYYRDQNLEESVLDQIEVFLPKYSFGLVEVYERGSFTFDCLPLFTYRDRAWSKDRFTSALPFTQRGPEVLIPLAGSAPVSVNFSHSGTINEYNSVDYHKLDGNSGQLVAESFTAGQYVPLSANGNVDFADAELMTTINNFRQAERLQSFYERDARGGARLNENNLAHWGVPTLDASLQRAEFLGGEHIPIVVSEVDQNSATEDGSTPQGTLAGKASAYNNGRLFKHFFREHGYVFVLSSIMSKAVYSQGIDRMFTRQNRIDYAWPEFAHLGEEPIYNKEVYAAAQDPNGVFGYTPRYSDYKSALSQVHGDFKGNLSFWLQQRKFENVPTLSKEFVMSEPDQGIFAVESSVSDKFLLVLNFGIRASRLLPFYGVPEL